MELDFTGILSPEEVENLFTGSEIEDPESPQEKPDKEVTEDEIDGDTIFSGSESVGENKPVGQEEAPSTDGTKPSPDKPNFYHSTLNALVEDGVLEGLTTEDVDNVQSPESFSAAIKKAVESKLDETQKRINEALEYNVPKDEIKEYENLISYLENITDEALNDETQAGEQLRRNLIAQDLQNKGYNQQQIARKVKSIFDSNSDIEEASDALVANKEFFNRKYQARIEENRRKVQEQKSQMEKDINTLKTSILDGEVFGGLKVDKDTRMKVVENISKPVYKDKETGRVLTAIEKYQKENRLEFVKNLGLLFTLTDGFKNIDKLVKEEVKKEVKSSVKELEHKINSTTRNSDGSFNYISGSSDDNSYIGAGIRLDI